MTLEEAIKKVVNYKNFLEVALAKDIRIADEKDVEAIDTVLNYIENESIPKEKVKESIVHLKGCVETSQGEELLIYDSKIDMLEELLGE